MDGFSLTHADDITGARRGSIATAHGTVETPAFFPVLNLMGGPTRKSGGIWSRTRNHLFNDESFQGAMFQAMSFLDFGVSPDALEEWRTKTLHEQYTDHPPVKPHHEKPADFTKPLFVDSGGFKLLNSDTFGGTPDEGGSENEYGIYTTPKSILDLQLDYGADIIATLDLPIPPNLREEEKTERMERSIDNAIECLRLLEDEEDSPLVYVAIHGHDYDDINWYVSNVLHRAEDISTSIDGFAIGSLVPLRSNVDTLVDIVQGATDAIPENRGDDLGLHVFGVGGQFCALLALLGVDSFDSSSYVQAAQFRKIIDVELPPSGKEPTPEEILHRDSPYQRRQHWWSTISVDELNDEWGCACSACKKLRKVGIDTMQSTLNGASYEEGRWIKSDFYALIAYHNFLVYQRELTRVRTLIDYEEGALLEYVAQLAQNDVKQIRPALKETQKRNTTIISQLRARGYENLIRTEQQTLKTNVPVDQDDASGSPISLAYSPDDFNILELADELGYTPPTSRDVLLVIPCSQRKPYSESRTHQAVESVIEPQRDRIHKVTVSGMFGPVPEDFESYGPVSSYEYVLTNVETDRQELVTQRVTEYLNRYAGEFDVVAGYATSKTYRTVIEEAFERAGDGAVFPRDPRTRSLTEHFRAENLEELASFLAQETTSSRST